MAADGSPAAAFISIDKKSPQDQRLDTLVEVFFEHTSEIDDVMELIEQSYKKQADE